MKTRAGVTGALAVLALTMAVPMGGMQQSGGLGQQDPLGPAIPPASQSGMPPMSSPSQQQQPPQPGSMPSSSRQNRTQLPSMSDETPNPLSRTPEEQARLQNTMRQREIARDTDRLLDLALELKEDVNKSNKDALSLNVVKKAEEIEKLARQVKEKMRN